MELLLKTLLLSLSYGTVKLWNFNYGTITALKNLKVMKRYILNMIK